MGSTDDIKKAVQNLVFMISVGLYLNKSGRIPSLDMVKRDSGHNGHKPKRPKPQRPQTDTAANQNGHRPERPQTGTATNRNGHKPKRPQTETATNQNGHKPKRPQEEIDTTIPDSAGYKFVCSIEISN